MVGSIADGEAVRGVGGDVATDRGVIRAVLVDEPNGWVAFFCTDPAATVADTLGCAADRFSLGVVLRFSRAWSG